MYESVCKLKVFQLRMSFINYFHSYLLLFGNFYIFVLNEDEKDNNYFHFIIIFGC